MERKIIYLDNAQSTRLDDRVLEAMEPYFFEYYGLPTTEVGHSLGVKLREDIYMARKKIAESINAETEELIFTFGATEANNIAIQGFLRANPEKRHVITSPIEHSSVLALLKLMEKNGLVELSIVNVDEKGRVDLDHLNELIRKDTALVSIQHANQEIGTIQNIEEIGKICHDNGVVFHTDAAQSFLKVPIDVKRMNIDMMSITAHKIHGPKGIGALYIRKDIDVLPLIEGPFAEFGKRPGTENVPAIIGFAKAVEIWDWNDVERMKEMRDYLIKHLLEIEDSQLNGAKGDQRLCNNVNISFKYIEGEAALLHLDFRGIIVTTGSACFSRTLEPSYIILALGKKHEDAHGSIRFSLSKYNTMDELPYVVESVKDVVTRLREISPIAKDSEEDI
ncbi:MAG: cysteine desulfurase family protein [Candidatus Asgardarchaeia archaeon]